MYCHSPDRWVSCFHEGQLVRQQLRIIVLVSLVRASQKRKMFLTAICRRDIPLVIAAYIAWKVYKRTSIVKLSEIPLEEALERAASDVEVEKERPLWRKLIGFLWD